MGEVGALPCTLLSCGCRDSLKLARGLRVKLLITHPGRCGMSPDISLMGHFGIPNEEVGETQEGGVKTVGNPNTRETWDTRTCFKLSLPGIQVLPFFFTYHPPVFCGPYYSVDLLTMNENEDYKTSPAFLSSFSLVLHAPKAIVSILRTSLTSLVC